MRNIVLAVGFACACATVAAAQHDTNTTLNVVLTGCLEKGDHGYVLTNASASDDDPLAAGSPGASDHPRPKLGPDAHGTTFRLEAGDTNLSKHVDKEVQIRATIAQADQRVSGTSGSGSGNDKPRNAKAVTSDGWPLAHVKDVQGVGDCKK
jgi:hypothetical protein